MKIALCFYGQSKTVDTRGISLDYKKSLSSFRQHLLSENDVDIFIHTWQSKDNNLINDLVKDFNPKKIIVEKSIFPNYKVPSVRKPESWNQDYSFDYKLQVASSRWDSQKKVNSLRKQYQKETGVKYDFIISCRFDIIFYKPFPWDLMCNEHYYFSNWHANWDPKHAVPGYNEPYFISGEELTDVYSSIFDDLHSNWKDNSDLEHYICNELNKSLEDKFSGHVIVRWQFLNKGVIDCERFIGVEHETWNLTRKSHILTNPWWQCPWDVNKPFNANSIKNYDLYRGSLKK